MKEQVRIEVVEFVTVNKEKYERLKRLDENVKKLINDLTYCANSKDGKNYVLNKPRLPPGLINVPFDDIKELLESLDN